MLENTLERNIHKIVKYNSDVRRSPLAEMAEELGEGARRPRGAQAPKGARRGPTPPTHFQPWRATLSLRLNKGQETKQVKTFECDLKPLKPQIKK